MSLKAGHEKYDVVILGSGLGGLACGAILSKEGMRVCIIEKNEQIGGSLQTFKRDGIKFDTGVHYLGGLDKGQNLYKLFNYLGIMERLKLERMDQEAFDVILFGDSEEEFPYGMGYDNFSRILIEKFPEEKGSILKYCKDIREICSSFPLYNIKTGDEYGDAESFTLGIKQYLERLTGNQRLRSVLAGSNLLYAGIGNKTPLYVHALVVNSYIESAWRCPHGGDQIAKLLAKTIKNHGSVIKRMNKVEHLHMAGEKVEYVQMENGAKIYGDKFVSNIHPSETLDMMHENAVRPSYRERIKGLKNSVAAFTLFAVLKPGTVKYKNRNYYYFDENDVWKSIACSSKEWPYTYGFFENVPQHQKEYLEAFSIISYMDYEEVKDWEKSNHTTLNEVDRGAGYEEFKRQKAELLLKLVEEKFPGMRGAVQSYYTATPLSYRDYIGSEDGSMYGVLQDFNEPMLTRVSPKTKIPNLFFTGQNVNLHGVLGVTVCAVLTCSMLLGMEYLVNKIVQANEAVV